MIQDKILCPKCQTRSLRNSIDKKRGELFCDHDHIYFTIWELVNVWGYDAGDFINQKNESLLPKGEFMPCVHKNIQDYPPFIPKMFVCGTQCKDCSKIWYPESKYEPAQRFDTLSMFEGEPIWKSVGERNEAYEMVYRMFEGVSEYDDYQDLKNTERNALGVGIQC